MAYTLLLLLMMMIMILCSATSLISLQPAQSSLAVTLHQLTQPPPSPAAVWAASETAAAVSLTFDQLRQLDGSPSLQPLGLWQRNCAWTTLPMPRSSEWRVIVFIARIVCKLSIWGVMYRTAGTSNLCYEGPKPLCCAGWRGRSIVNWKIIHLFELYYKTPGLLDYLNCFE